MIDYNFTVQPSSLTGVTFSTVPDTNDLPVEIRVTFNRGLTWSEREAFREWTLKSDRVFHFGRSDVVYISDHALAYFEESTRILYREVADFVARQFVNVHPRAVKSISPEVVV